DISYELDEDEIENLDTLNETVKTLWGEEFEDELSADDKLLYGDDVRKNQLKTAIEFYFSSRPGQYRDREKEKIKLLSKELKFNDNDLAEFAIKVYEEEEFEEELSKDEVIDLISELE